MIVKIYLRIQILIILLLSNFAMHSFAATPGPMPKTGVYESKCGTITVLDVSKKTSKFVFKLEATNCKMSSGTIEKAEAEQLCSDECSWFFRYSEFPECSFVIDVKGDVIEIAGDVTDRAQKCGFGGGVHGNGKYKRVKR
jgi:hypothetical protein